MNNPFLYPGKGIVLRQAAAATGNAPASADMSIITVAAAAYSLLIGAHDCLELMFEFVAAAAATGDIVIQKVDSQTAANNGETFDTITLASQRSANWNAGESLVGFFRILNSTNQAITIYAQKRIN
jgi:hypothetical protein